MQARLQDCDVVVAATGDDKVNLVLALLAKTEFGVDRVVARVNHPKNEWLFNESWGVDVSVSSPRLLAAVVEEAVSVGDLVRLLTFQRGAGEPRRADPRARRRPRGPDGRARSRGRPTAALVAILREGRVLLPSSDGALEAGDELLLVAKAEVEGELDVLLTRTTG